MSRQTPSERLLARLKDMGVPVDDRAPLTRTYAGSAQRAAGVWVWRHGPLDGFTWVGSIYPVTELIRRPRLTATYEYAANEWTIFPYGDGDQPTPTCLIEPERSTR